jgi:hypothetical protein
VDVYQDATTRAFAPFSFGVRAGDTVVWHFPTANPGNAVARRVYVPGTANPYTPGHYAIAPYTPTYANEFVGPMIEAPSGIFVLGPTGYGMIEQPTPCSPLAAQMATRLVGTTPQYLCRCGETAACPDNYQRTMDSTWVHPEITGVFIRLQWKDLQPTRTSWDDTVLMREADAAVANGKLYSVVIESGRDGQPSWLFDPVERGGAGLPKLKLIWNDERDVTSCTDIAAYADPTTEVYKQLYKEALTHVADVLKQNSARYRALAYIKPSGANRATGENRLPSRCKSGCRLCNNEVWAKAGYTPDKLYAFYEEQFAHIATHFPGKSMSFMLIQAGFPRVGKYGCYENATGGMTCPPKTPLKRQIIPGGTEQTETIINRAVAAYPTGRFVVEHQGLDMKPGSVNKWVTDIGATGKPTMFQTSASGQVGSPAQLADTIQNLWDNSTASALEIYEERLWEANRTALGGLKHSTRTIGDWNTALHARRRTAYPALGDPAPRTYTFTFRTPVVQPLPPPNNYEYNAYVDPRLQPVTQAGGCLDGFSPCVIVRE